MNILFCGLGSIGKRQARLVRELYPEHALWALRSSRGQEKNDLAIPELRSWDEVDRLSFQIAFITSPTFLHTEHALACARRKMHLFVEKPIDCKTTGLEDLLTTIEKYRLTAYLAYPLRYHPVVRELKEILQGKTILHARAACSSYLPSWRPNQDHLKNYSAHRAQGGGVILDLSHDIDLAEYLFGEIQKIEGRFGRCAEVTIDSEDFADLLLTHPRSHTNLHLNYFSRRRERYVAADTNDFSVRANLVRNSLFLQSNTENWEKEIIGEPDAMYRDQLRYFFGHLDNPHLQNNLFEAGRLFRKLIEFRGAS